MRTRRSWKNQDRLFKYLFSSPKEPMTQKPEPLTKEQLSDMFWLSKTDRNFYLRKIEKEEFRKATKEELLKMEAERTDGN